MTFSREKPGDNEELRRALYSGTIFQLSPTPASARLVSAALDLVERELGSPVREAQFRFGDEEFFQKAGRLRKTIYTEAPYLEMVRDLLAEMGFDPGSTAFDPARLRVVPHRGFENPRAAPIYYAHRDTWYAHSQAEITWWVPLHDLGEEETFVFYPDYFQNAVGNNSAEFDHDQWLARGEGLKIGWQNREAGRTHLYPGQVGAFEPGRVWSFSAQAGEVLLFSAAHFHQTRPNTTGRTRFSLDFRTVDLRDHASGVGAPNVDNGSRGSATRDYIHPC